MKNDIKSRAPKTTAGAGMLSHCNNASLRKAARRLGKLYDAVLDPSGLKATQFSLVTQIYDLGSPTMAELAKSLLMDLSAMRHSLGPLMRDGLVRLRVEPKDRADQRPGPQYDRPALPGSPGHGRQRARVPGVAGL